MNYAQLIDELNSLSTSKIYTNDCMNWKKVRNAIAKYAPAVNENDVCLLIDDTVFGSGKAGLLMDKTHIYVKEVRYSPMSRPNNHKIKIELG